MKKLISAVSLTLVLAACATSPTGRHQLMLIPDSQMDQMGVQAFDEMKQQTPISKDQALNTYVKCVLGPVAEQAKDDTGVKNWEIVVFQDPQANAFALPGGKIGVYSGLMKVAKSDGQLAAVVGHEVGHVIAKHGNERASETVVENVGLAGLSAVLGGQQGPKQQALLMGAMGITQFGIALPHSRTQESEADVIGEQLMAKAGYDPAQSIELWRNFMAAGQGSPPEFLSDHPADANRVKNLQAHMSEAMATYQAAKAAGRNPEGKCTRPASAS
jgi:predicted Zn-dependent protease